MKISIITATYNSAATVRVELMDADLLVSINFDKKDLTA